MRAWLNRVAMGRASLASVSCVYGIGVVRDPARAAALFKRACDGGSMLGCYDLGVLHTRGLSRPQAVDVCP